MKILSTLLIAIALCILSGCIGDNNNVKPDNLIVENEISIPKVQVDVIKIGVLVPLNGNGINVGTEVKALCELFEDVINNIGDLALPFHKVEGLPNLDNIKVEFVYGDLSTPKATASEVERLIVEEGVIGITGTFSSDMTKIAAEITEKHGVILLSEGTSVTLMESGYINYGRTYPNDASFVKDTFDYLNYLNTKQDARIKTVAFVCEDSDFGTNIANILRTYAKEYGFKVVEDISYNAKVSDVTSEVSRLKNSEPDVVVMSSYITDSVLFISSFKEQNYFPNMLFGQRGGFTSSDFTTLLGEDSNYCFTTSRWNSDFNNKVSQDLMLKYKESYSDGVDLISDVLSVSWDAYLIAIMANQAGSTDVESLRQDMLDGVIVHPENDPTGLPGYQYGIEGQNSVTSAIVLQIIDGIAVTVYPENLSSSEAVYPAPRWDERN